MLIRRWRRIVRGSWHCTLAAAVLFGGAPRLGVCHSHAGGNRPHSHDRLSQNDVTSREGDVHRNGHARPHRHPHAPRSHREKETSSTERVTAGTCHVHLWLLG